MNTDQYVIPAACDLRPKINEVEDQGRIGSCTANAVCTMLEICAERGKEKFSLPRPTYDFSRLYLYYWERNFEARHTEEGAYTKDAFEVLQNKGVCSESTWAYVDSQVNTQPPTQCDVEAKDFKIVNYEQLIASTSIAHQELALPKTLLNIKHAVASGRPVVISMMVTTDMQAKGSTLRDWRKWDWDTKSQRVGGHAVVIIGYDDACQRFLVQNSWGAGWGDGGFFGIPYRYFGDWSVISEAFCTHGGFFTPVPVEGYGHKVYDPARINLIKQFCSYYLKPVVDGARDYSVGYDEIDYAMGWESGQMAKLSKL